LKSFKNLVEHIPMLSAHGDHHLKSFFLLERFDDGCHFDGFRTGSKKTKDFNFSSILDMPHSHSGQAYQREN